MLRILRVLFCLCLLPLALACESSNEFTVGSSSFHSIPILGSGVMMTETRSVSPFHGVELEAVAAVKITVGPSQSVRVDADDNIIDHIQTRVSGGSLIIDSKADYDSPLGVTVDITVPDLQSVELAGVGSIHGYSISSSGTFRASLSGVGTIRLQGVCSEFVGKLGGSGNLEAQGLVCGASRIVLSGRGDCRTTATQELDATISGHGDVYYSGNPPAVRSTITGDGRLIPA